MRRRSLSCRRGVQRRGRRRPVRLAKSRHRLTRTRKNLSRPGRRHETRRNRGRTRDRGRLTARERRTQGLHARDRGAGFRFGSFRTLHFAARFGLGFRDRRGGLMPLGVPFSGRAFGGRRRCEFRFRGRRHIGRTLARVGEPAPHLQGDVVVERAGVGLLVVNPQFGQQIEDHVGLDLEFTSQLVDANLNHKWRSGGIGHTHRCLMPNLSVRPEFSQSLPLFLS